MLRKIINKALSGIDERLQAKNLDFQEFEQITVNITGNDKWSVFQRKIAEELNKSPANFLRQKTISFTLHPNQQNLGSDYFYDLINSIEMDDVYFKLLTEDNFGNPFNLRVYPRTSPTLVQHIHHLMMIERFFATKIWNFSRIVEFGGGYGSLARLLARLNYKGEHVICDLNFMTLLQKFYLLNLQVTKHSLNWVETIENVNIDNCSDTILIATWSFSETNMEFRNQILTKMLSFDNIFLTFQKNFAGINNLQYFKTIAEQDKDIFIIDCELYPNNYYFIKRKNVG